MRQAVLFRLRLRLQNTATLPTPILSLNLVQRLRRQDTLKLLKHLVPRFQSFCLTDADENRSQCTQFAVRGHSLSVIDLALQLCLYCRVRSFLHVGSRAHPLDGKGQRSRTEELVVDFIHLLDYSPMWVLEGRVTLCIVAGYVATVAHGW